MEAHTLLLGVQIGAVSLERSVAVLIEDILPLPTSSLIFIHTIKIHAYVY